MDLIAIITMFAVSLSLGLGGTRAILGVLFSLTTHQTLSLNSVEGTQLGHEDLQEGHPPAAPPLSTSAA